MSKRLLGPYRLMEERHRGRDAVVHLAWDTLLNRRVEVRTYPALQDAAEDDPEIQATLVKLARRFSSLRHPGLLVPIGLPAKASGETWLANEFIDAMPLRAYIRRLGRVPWRQTAMIIQEILAGLAFVHSRELVHGSLDGENISVEATGRIILGPFEFTDRVLRVRGTVASDPASIRDDLTSVAPEVLRGDAPSAAADLFSVGTLGFEMLTGTRAFRDEAAVLAFGLGQGEAPDPAELAADADPELVGIIMGMMVADPAARPESATFLRDRLREYLSAAGVHDVRGTLRRTLERQRGALEGSVLGGAMRANPNAPASVEVAEPDASDAVPDEPRPRRSKRRVKPSDALKPPPKQAVTNSRNDSGTGPETSVKVTTGQSATRITSVGTGQSAPKGAEAVLAALEAETVRSERQDYNDGTSRSAWMLVAALVLGLGVVAWWGFFSTPDTVAPTTVASAPIPNGRTASPERQVDLPAAAPTARVAERTLTAPSEDRQGLVLARTKGLIAVGSYGAAATQARSAIDETRGGAPELQLVLGDALVAQGRVDEAVQAMALADSDGGFEGALHAGTALAADGRCGDALEWFDKAQESGAPAPRLGKLRGNCLVIEGRPKEALEPLMAALEGDGGTDLDVLLPLARALESLGRKEEAAAFYARAKTIAPDDRQAALGAARNLAATGHAQAALDGLKALPPAPVEEGEEAPARAPVELETLGDAAFRAGKYAEAAGYFAEALKATEGKPDSRLLRNRALALDRAGQDGAAVTAYRAASKAAPKDGELHALRAAVHLRAGARGDAIKAWESAFAIEPKRLDDGVRAATMRLTDGDARGAAKGFARVLRKSPRDPDALQNLASAQVALGQDAQAINTLTHLAAVRPRGGATWMDIAALYQRQGKKSEMAAALKKACGLGQSSACK